MSQATLPKALETRTLKDVPIGKSVYVTPWTMEVDEFRRLWIDMNSTFSEKSGGTVNMKLTRTKYGFDVEVNDNFTWTLKRLNPDNPYLPVGDLKF